jgi:hypothetical protein
MPRPLESTGSAVPSWQTISSANNEKNTTREALRGAASDGNPAEILVRRLRYERLETVMIDRQKLETVLSRRFPGASNDRIASAANAIMGLEDEWQEVSTYDDFGYKIAPGHCLESCSLAREAQAGTEFRVLRRRTLADA